MGGSHGKERAKHARRANCVGASPGGRLFRFGAGPGLRPWKGRCGGPFGLPRFGRSRIYGGHSAESERRHSVPATGPLRTRRGANTTRRLPTARRRSGSTVKTRGPISTGALPSCQRVIWIRRLPIIPRPHQDLFLNTTIEPEPFASIDSHIIYPEDLFWQQIDENIKKYRYIIPKYTILDIGDTVKVAKRDLDAFNLWEVCPIDDYDEDQYIIHERYNDYTICCSDNNIDYLYLYNNVEDMDIMMRDYMNEHKPYKMPNNTVIEYGNKVFPITQNTRILDPSKIPEDWRDRSELLEYGYMTDNVGKVSLNEKIEINNIPKIFTIHIKKERRAYFVYATPTSDTKLYRIYASFSKGCLAKLPDEVTPYTKKPTSYSDITIICHKIHYNQRV